MGFQEHISGRNNVSVLLRQAIADIPGDLIVEPGELAVVSRAQYLLPPMKSFTSEYLSSGGYLSKAKLNDGQDLDTNSANFVAHMLGKCNYLHNLDQTSISRDAAWKYMIDACIDQRMTIKPGTIYERPQNFWPSCVLDEAGNRVYQVLGVRLSNVNAVCVVLEVIRGALVQGPRDKAVKELQTTATKAAAKRRRPAPCLHTCPLMPLSDGA